DDGDGGRRGKLGQPLLAEGPDHDGVAEPGEDPGGVGDRLAPTELHLVGLQHDGVPAELTDRHLEGDPGPGGRLLEDHRHREALEAAGMLAAPLLQLRGTPDRGRLLGRRGIAGRQEVTGREASPRSTWAWASTAPSH